MQGHLEDLQRQRATSGKRNFIELIKTPIYLEAVFVIETIYQPQSSLEKKDNSSILKDFFFQEWTHTFSYQ